MADYIHHYALSQQAHEAVIFDSVRLSYAMLSEQVNRCAKALMACGIKKGDRVAVLSTPRPEYWITFLASTQVGAIWMGLNPKYRLQELRYLIGDAQPKLIFTIADFESDDYCENIQRLRNDCTFIHSVVSLTAVLRDSLSFEAFLVSGNTVSDKDMAQRRATVSPMEPALLVYTSGSTGKPKGAVLSHYGLCFGACVAASHVNLQDPRILCNLPINHVACVADTCCANLVAGGTIVFQERYDPSLVLHAIERERLTLLGGVPTMLLGLFDHPDFKYTDFSSLELIAWGGAAMPIDTIKRLQQLAPRMLNVYGMTETAANTTYTSPDADLVELSETIGRPSPHMPCRIVNDAGMECDIGEHGELQFKGEYLLLEYLNGPEATRDVYTEDGWLHTGDLGYWRENGTISLVGRLSDMFKSGGYNVYPREIEDVLESYPAIEMAAVVAVPDAKYQEVGVAFLQVNDTTSFDADALRDYCKSHLANYKIPKHFSLLNQLPTLPVGKVDKVTLKQQAINQQNESV
ncbi:class I adenylate-forming enzyme family protein [SAR92 clade bacterium H246]